MQLKKYEIQEGDGQQTPLLPTYKRENKLFIGSWNYNEFVVICLYTIQPQYIYQEISKRFCTSGSLNSIRFFG